MIPNVSGFQRNAVTLALSLIELKVMLQVGVGFAAREALG